MKLKILTTLLVAGVSSIASAQPSIGQISANLGNVRVAVSVENLGDSDGAFSGCLAYMKDNSVRDYVDGFCVDYDVNSGNQSIASFDANRFHTAAKTGGAYFLLDTKVSWAQGDEPGFTKTILSDLIETIDSGVEALESLYNSRSAKVRPMPLQMLAEFLKKMLPQAEAQISLTDDAISLGRKLFRYLSRSKKSLIEVMQQGVDEAYDIFRRTGAPNVSINKISKALQDAFQSGVNATGEVLIHAEGVGATATISRNGENLVIRVMGK